MRTRRDFSKAMLAALPLPAALAEIHSTIAGVHLGVQTYSFRDRPLDAAIQAMAQIGLGECELFSPHVEPSGSREALRQWRLAAPLDVFRAVRGKFDSAGVRIYAYNLSFRDDFTDEEIDRCFLMAAALGVNVVTASSTLTAAQRLAPFAEKHKMTVAFHGHSEVDKPNEFAKPESFAQALALSKRFAINLDIGHFWAAGYDPVAFIQSNHERILVLHLKDRKKNQGPNVPWGEGDTPIRPVLQLLKQKQYPMRAFIEYEYAGGDPVAEVKKCYDYCKAALA